MVPLCPPGTCVSCDLLRREPVERSAPAAPPPPPGAGTVLELYRALPEQVHELEAQGWHAGAASSHSEGHGWEVVMVREITPTPNASEKGNAP